MTTRYKLVFFTPIPPLEQIKAAIFAVGAGSYPGGNYTQCAFQCKGTGQFKPGGSANPHIGTLGELEMVEEMRVEIMCFGRDVAVKAVEALKREHPYEEVAYEVYKLEDL